MTVRFHPALLAAALCGAASTGAWATEYGTVVSSTPIVAAVPVPQRECVDQPVVYQQPTSGVGALLGAIAGAAIGHNVGGGDGRALATGVGLVAGSAIGDRVEGNSLPAVSSTVRQCRTVTRYENRTVGYDVVYDYQGQRRHTRMAQEPGDRIALNVQVSPADAQAPAPVYDEAPPTAYAPSYAPVYAPPPAVVYGAPVYAAPAYAPRVIVNPWPVLRFGGYDRWHGWRGDRGDEHHDDGEHGRGWRGDHD
ncbi:MAG: glycine zipper 2TM domain-containing protein [Burkholderiales bacterium]|nr:glycine zipper 2TM domain-containing protein [Burkholderiales bacterium]